MGHSEGGAIAPMVAAKDPKLAAIVLMAGPAYSGEAIITYQIGNLIRGDTSIPVAKKDSATKATRAQFDSTSGRAAWMKWFLAYDPLPTIKQVKQPVLILQGATDQQVARLFQRQIAIDALVGALAGAALASILILLIVGGARFASELAGQSPLGWDDAIVLALLPLAAAGLATLVARRAVIGALRERL